MHEILEARFLAPNIKFFRVHAARVARTQRPGQFVMVRLHERGERIPLTIEDADPASETICLVVQAIGKTTRLMNRLEARDHLLDVVGPLGRPSDVRHFGRAVVVGGGVGCAIAYPTARALAAAGNTVISIIGARNAELVLLESEIRAISGETIVMTDDGSYGRKGFVTDPLAEMIAAGRRLDYVLAIGPVAMMKAVADTTREKAVRTVVSLNSIMVDGTGMCGGCRVIVGGARRFACVDGPEFDAHDVDFEVLARRNVFYRGQEKAALERFEVDPKGETERVRESCASAARQLEVSRLEP